MLRSKTKLQRGNRFHLSYAPVNGNTFDNYTSDILPGLVPKSPYVQTPPRNECWQNLGSGVVVCTNTQSKGQLRSEMKFGSGLHSVAGIPADTPLNRILQREPVGPWELVGYITTNDAATSQSRDRTMVIHAQTVDTRRDRYNYRVLDSNGVPIDVGEKVVWKMDGETFSVPGQSTTFTLHLYEKYK
jgi:hypothetical protein